MADLPTTVAVGDGARRYFSLADSKSSWTLPPKELDSWLANIEAKAIAQQQRIQNGDDSRAAGSSSISSYSLVSKTLKADLKKRSNKANGDWAVKIHTDTGQV
jgi:hypothetical protein